jgi:molybdenum cofactor guanylyltransferase
MTRGRDERAGEPIGVILAGGQGRRIGGTKAVVELAGRPLINYPLTAMMSALHDVAVIAKPDTVLPPLPGVTVWIERAAPQHPLVGITEALALAEGRPVLVCAADLPFVSSALIRRLAATEPGTAAAVIASAAGKIQPLLGCYRPRAAELLSRWSEKPERPVREVVGAIRPLLIEVEDQEELFNVNAPEDLLRAAAILDRRRQITRR